jgi:hypothetical protein
MTGEYKSEYQISIVMALTVNRPKIGLCPQGIEESERAGPGDETEEAA